MIRHRILSLFSNIGVAEAYLEELGHDVIVANELDPKRASLYQKIYPKTNMICGDITDENIQRTIVEKAKELGVDFIIATPPCQGMSKLGSMDPNDVRNRLIYYAVEIIKKVL